MNPVIAYKFEDVEPAIRVVVIAGDPWFVANDVAKVLGYAESAKLTRMLDDDEKGLHIVETLGGVQDMNVISESGLFAAILKSRRPEAKRFRKWVTGEVLPSIRHTGKYELPGHQPPPQLPLDFDASRLSASVAVVREARRLFGPVGARNIWLQLGLPQPIVDSEGSQLGDPWAEPIRDWLAGRAETNAAEVAAGVGIAPLDFTARRRIRALLQLFGWQDRVVRRGHETVRRWVRLQSVEA